MATGEAAKRARGGRLPSKRRNELIAHALSHVILIVGSLSMILPLGWMILTSLKSEFEVFLYPPRWMPRALLWENYKRAFEIMPFALFTLNSTKLAVLNTLGVTLSCSVAGFSFARLQFPGRDKLFMGLLATMMIPGAVTVVPVYIIFARLGWIDSHLPLWVPSFLGGAWGVFFVRQFFLTLPQDLFDAAEIDGCSPSSTFWRIALPLSKPVLATLGLFTFMGSWNNLMGPLIYLNTLDKMTLPIGLTFFRGMYQTDWPGLMAGSVVTIMPILIAFLFTQRYFVQGIVLTGLKG